MLLMVIVKIQKLWLVFWQYTPSRVDEWCPPCWPTLDKSNTKQFEYNNNIVQCIDTVTQWPLGLVIKTKKGVIYCLNRVT